MKGSATKDCSPETHSFARGIFYGYSKISMIRTSLLQKVFRIAAASLLSFVLFVFDIYPWFISSTVYEKEKEKKRSFCTFLALSLNSSSSRLTGSSGCFWWGKPAAKKMRYPAWNCFLTFITTQRISTAMRALTCSRTYLTGAVVFCLFLFLTKRSTNFDLIIMRQ